MSTFASIFGKKTVDVAPKPAADRRVQPQTRPDIARREQVLSQSTFYKHWNAIKAEGITASQFIEFLQPLADLDGISVSYIYNDEAGKERIYNHRHDEPAGVNPLFQAILERKLSKEKALTFALNEEGRVWIESNFMELKDLK